MVKADAGNTWSKLCDINNYPDLGASPPRLDKTNLSETQHTYEPGLPDPEDWNFEVNHTKELETSLADYIGVEKEYAVWFGGVETAGAITPSGVDGKYTTSGKLNYYPTAGGVDEIRKGQITIVRTKATTSDTSDS